MRILYIGDGQVGSTSLHRADALRRLGHEVTLVDATRALDIRSKASRIWHYRTGYVFKVGAVQRTICRQLEDHTFDVGWINGGEAVGKGLLADLKKRCTTLVNYNNDDPTGCRDWTRWITFRRCIRHYDLLVVVRPQNLAEYPKYGAQRVQRVFMGYDPVAHAPIGLTGDERRTWASEVLFAGTWMPERGPFLKRLIELGVPITIRGDRWHKAREWDAIKHRVAGPGAHGRDYVAAIQSAKVCLGLLSKGNRDLHTTRSTEIPYLGAVFCAERTIEHTEMYREEYEAVFWSDADECAKKCHALLQDEARRLRIAAAGQKKVRELRLSNDEILAEILTEVVRVQSARLGNPIAVH